MSPLIPPKSCLSCNCKGPKPFSAAKCGVEYVTRYVAWHSRPHDSTSPYVDWFNAPSHRPRIPSSSALRKVQPSKVAAVDLEMLYFVSLESVAEGTL